MSKKTNIESINALITEHKLDFDQVDVKTDMKAGEVRDLLSDVNDAIAEAAGPAVVTVAELCKEASIDPKTVRSRLRNMYAKDEANELPQPLDGASQRWTYPEDQREALKELIGIE